MKVLKKLKYPNKYGEDRTPITQKEAEKNTNNLIDSVRKETPECTEKSFWLVLEDEMWNIYADSVKNKCKGKLIKEFKIN